MRILMFSDCSLTSVSMMSPITWTYIPKMPRGLVQFSLTIVWPRAAISIDNLAKHWGMNFLHEQYKLTSNAAMLIIHHHLKNCHISPLSSLKMNQKDRIKTLYMGVFPFEIPDEDIMTPIKNTDVLFSLFLNLEWSTEHLYRVYSITTAMNNTSNRMEINQWIKWSILIKKSLVDDTSSMVENNLLT